MLPTFTFSVTLQKFCAFDQIQILTFLGFLIFNRQPETVFVPQMLVPENGQSHMIFTTVSKRDAVS